MSNQRILTKAELLEIAGGIANGRSMIEVAGTIGVDRSTLSGWLSNGRFLSKIAAAMSSPADLGADALENLRADGYLDGERLGARDLRNRFARVVLRTFPDFFAAERKEREAEERARQRMEEAAEREAESKEREAEEREARVEECLEADFFNRSTWQILNTREWRNGTAYELAQGLDTPEKRREYRCRNGIIWECAGFGPDYKKKDSAADCRLAYRGEDVGELVAWREDYERRRERFEAHYEQWHKAVLEADERYRRDPFKRRDPRLPTTRAEAETLLRKIEAGADFAEACKPGAGQKRRDRARRSRNPRQSATKR